MQLIFHNMFTFLFFALFFHTTSTNLYLLLLYFVVVVIFVFVVIVMFTFRCSTYHFLLFSCAFIIDIFILNHSTNKWPINSATIKTTTHKWGTNNIINSICCVQSGVSRSCPAAFSDFDNYIYFIFLYSLLPLIGLQWNLW